MTLGSEQRPFRLPDLPGRPEGSDPYSHNVNQARSTLARLVEHANRLLNQEDGDLQRVIAHLESVKVEGVDLLFALETSGEEVRVPMEWINQAAICIRDTIAALQVKMERSRYW